MVRDSHDLSWSAIQVNSFKALIFSSDYLENRKICRNFIECKMHVSVFAGTFVQNIFYCRKYILSNTWDMHRSACGFYVNDLISTKIVPCQEISVIFPNIKRHEIRFNGSWVATYRQTWWSQQAHFLWLYIVSNPEEKKACRSQRLSDYELCADFSYQTARLCCGLFRKLVRWHIVEQSNLIIFIDAWFGRAWEAWWQDADYHVSPWKGAGVVTAQVCL